ncbi:hypothetical protein INR49_029368 [Caranx melampygus]|nr:hypothetical protein INR49_029368 [Caranx melampygus]
MPTGYQIRCWAARRGGAAAAAAPAAAAGSTSGSDGSGLPITYSGLQDITSSHIRTTGTSDTWFRPLSLTEVRAPNNGFDLKAAAPYHHALLARGGAFYPPYRPGSRGSRARHQGGHSGEHGSSQGLAERAPEEPVPDQGEKIMLAIITKMTSRRSPTWFAPRGAA